MKPNQIFAVYGDNPYQLTQQLLARLPLESMIPPNAKIALKPNLVIAKPASSGATTHPEIAAAIIEYLQQKGFRDISIIEGSWLGENTTRAFDVCGFTELGRKYQVPVINLKTDSFTEVKVGDFSLKICRKALETGFLINLPVLKAHCQTALTCSLKNLKGCIPDAEKRRFHSQGLHRPIAALAKALPVGLTIVDGICGDLTFEEGGNPAPMGRILAGTDPVLLDAYAAGLIGLDSTDVPYIGMAAKLGVGSDRCGEAEIVELNPDQKPIGSQKLTRRAQELARYIEENQTCSACLGSLIHALHQLDEEGQLRQISKKIKTGQGFRKQTGAGPGIGNCTCGLTPYLPGCPPTAREIADFLRGI